LVQVRKGPEHRIESIKMKKVISPLAFVFALSVFVFTGCSGSNVDTSKVQSAFSSAPAGDKANVDAAVASVKSGDYSGALASLQKAASNTKLTEEQKAAVQDLIQQIQAKLTEGANKVSDAASKSAGDLQKSLGK
jgi:hypothetical protein